MIASCAKIKLLLLTSLLLLIQVNANAQSSYEELQAAYIYNFAKYIKWPEETPSFVIGIFGDPTFIETLRNTLKGRRISGKQVEIRLIEKFEQSLECNIVFVPSSGSKSVVSLCSTVVGKNVLVVTEDDLIKKGAYISFIVKDDKLVFKIKQDALVKAGLKASEGLLKLAILL